MILYALCRFAELFAVWFVHAVLVLLIVFLFWRRVRLPRRSVLARLAWRRSAGAGS